MDPVPTLEATESRLSLWVLAMRPKTLWAGATPVLIGSAMAAERGAFHALSAIAALIGALLLQIGANFANDYFDYVKGADTDDRLGPLRVTQAGLIKPQVMKGAIILTFLLTFVPGAYIVFRGGPIFLGIGLASILCGLLYTAGPFPLGYLGLGELFVFIFFGPVATGGTYYLQTGSIPPLVLLAGAAPGLFSVAILTVNNLRDIDGDRNAGKKTLAVRYGPTFARFEYLTALVLASVAIPGLLALLTRDHYWALSATAALLVSAPALRAVFSPPDGPSLNEALATTGKALLIFSLLFSIGWMVS